MTSLAPLHDTALGRAAKARARRVAALWKAVAYVALSLGGVTFVLPLLWMLSTSLKAPGAVFAYPPEWLPRKGATKQIDLRFDNYPKAWNALTLRRPWMAVSVPYAVRFSLAGRTIQIGPVQFPGFHIRSAFAAFYLNSLLVAICVTIGEVFTSSLAAYAFARLHFPGRDKLFLGYLGTLMVPYVVTMIPVFILLRLLHLIDTYAALIVPVMFSAYGTFLLRQFFLTIPTELEDAARIDGCSKWGIYTNVILPLSKPALATLTTFVFLSNWNSFMWPLIVIQSPEKRTLPLGLYAFMGQYTTDWTLLMAASLMVMAPVLLVFVLGQRYFVKGIVMSGLKG